jgi:carboxyl-terminal processing protease
MKHHLAAASLLFVTDLTSAQAEPAKASPDAVRYLEAALDQIEKGSRVYSTDWQALRAKALAAIAAAAAKAPADTYPAIRAALVNLGDPHGRLLEPGRAKWMASGRPAKSTGLFVVPRDGTVAQIVPNSPAAAAGLAIGDLIVAVEGMPGFTDLPRFEFDRLLRSGQRPDCSTAPLSLSVRTGTAAPRAVQVPLATVDEYLAPTGRRLDGNIGYLELPGAVGAKAANYDDAVHALLGQLDDGSLRGCIVDLRRNTGGKVEPMLAAIGPLAGNGQLGAYASANNSSPWSYDAQRGAAIFEGYELANVANPHAVRDDLPVAVLTGPMTAQAGEALVVAFAGRARTRRFGLGTRGVPIGSTTIALADGALLVLTVTVQADRSGTRYDGVIPPDEMVASDWTRFGAADDPVLVAASRWLLSFHQGK